MATQTSYRPFSSDGSYVISDKSGQTRVRLTRADSWDTNHKFSPAPVRCSQTGVALSIEADNGLNSGIGVYLPSFRPVSY